MGNNEITPQMIIPIKRCADFEIAGQGGLSACGIDLRVDLRCARLGVCVRSPWRWLGGWP